MRRLLLVALLAVAGFALPHGAQASHTWQGSFMHHTLPAGAAYPARDYWTYVPPSLPPSGERALVVFLHGCTQSAEDAALGTRWNDLADARGFVVAYPDQDTTHVDGNAAGCWNSGQSEVFARDQGELGSVATITRSVASTYGADPSRVYVIGLSGGAGMASSMAAVYPDLYSGVGVVAGCGYLCADATGDIAYHRMGTYARVVPAFLAVGSADEVYNPALGELAVHQWVGTNDLADDGAHNGSVSPVPTIENRDLDQLSSASPGSGDTCLHDYPRNPCPAGALGIDTYPTTIRRFAGAGGQTIVEAWLIHGLSHNYPNGDVEGSFTDPHGPDLTTAAFDFFESH
jgi:poly(hydroxyalkanoate) depolymerase family esterase